MFPLKESCCCSWGFSVVDDLDDFDDLDDLDDFDLDLLDELLLDFEDLS